MTQIELEHSASGVWTLLLSRPEQRNALDARMCQELTEAVATVRSDSEARALVVGGVGPSFCAGADLEAVFGDIDRPVAAIRRSLHAVYESFLGIRELSIPTLAAVQGSAVGAGLNLALVCDIRIAAPDARFAASFTRIGLHPGGGCTSFLVHALGAQRALALLLDGGSFDSEQAVAWGVALEEADDPMARAGAMAAVYAQLEHHLVTDIKRAVTLAGEGGFDATLEFESWAQASSAKGPKVQETVARYSRTPKE